MILNIEKKLEKIKVCCQINFNGGRLQQMLHFELTRIRERLFFIEPEFSHGVSLSSLLNNNLFQVPRRLYFLFFEVSRLHQNLGVMWLMSKT